MSTEFITGLDVGTAAIKVAVSQNDNGRPVLRFVAKYPSLGMRKGAIVDLAEASQSINRALSEVKKISKSAAKNIYVSIGTSQAKVQPSRGIVAVSRADTEIYEEDISRVVKASQAVNLIPNRTIIHNITREFIVDGVSDIVDPVGLSGNRLEVDSFVVDAFAPHIKSLVKAVELAGGEIGGLVFSPLLSARSALTKSQKDLGVALVDIGFGTTGVVVYEENKLIGLAKFPVGAGNISNDLAIGLKIPVSAAENLKLNYGYALAKDIGSKEEIEVKKFFPEAKGSVSRRFVSEIIESRLAEIFEFINNELKLIGKAGKLPGGVVLVGGGSKLPGLTELVKQELKLSSQIGLLAEDVFASGHRFGEFVEDPEFVPVLGLLAWGIDEENWRGGSLSGFKIKNLVRYFLP